MGEATNQTVSFLHAFGVLRLVSPMSMLNLKPPPPLVTSVAVMIPGVVVVMLLTVLCLENGLTVVEAKPEEMPD
jgi:hypothetical protein